MFSLNSLLWLWGGFLYSFAVPLAAFNIIGMQAFFVVRRNRWGWLQGFTMLVLASSCFVGMGAHALHRPWLPLPEYVGNWTAPVALIYIVALVVAITFYGRAEADKSRAALELAHQKSESLLLNILPRDVADELKDKGHSAPVRIESVTVMFTDFAGFTKISESLSPEQVVDELDKCFSYFDQIMEKYGLEKLKTIGDSYMCAGGIPKVNHTHAIDCCLAAMEIQSFMNQMKDIKAMQGLPYWELRLGIHTGPLVAGVVGHKKFAYDVWGDTVNTASRMESSGTTGRINISSATHEQVKFLFDCEHRGPIAAKNKGMIDMFYLVCLKHRFSKGGEGRGRVPNARFHEIYTALKRGARLKSRLATRLTG
ncbi:MAG: adenylate/guanylate cyclase domain-containing protein [Turneriella sp.]|nr:adenylate/guanylate cyclase domain-containing protein [Turneriella sp.]